MRLEPRASDPMRIAVSGAGLIGRRHVELLKADPGAEPAAVVDPCERARSYADAQGLAWHPSLPDLLAAERPDGVIVATPNRCHVDHARICLKARVPVLVEKPIADTLVDAQVLVDAVNASGVPLLVGHHRRHSPLLTSAREVIRSGQLGRIVAVMGSAVFYKPDDYFEAAPWRREPGGGPLLVNMIHEVDDLRFLCGDVESVHATASNRIRGFEVEDTVAMTLNFSNGALGTFMLSDTAASARSWEQTAAEDSSYAHYSDEDCYVIAGTRGSLSIPTMRLRAHVGAPSWWTATEDKILQVARRDPLAIQLQHFCAVISGAVDPLISAAEATESLRVTLGIAQSVATGQAVTLQHRATVPDVPVAGTAHRGASR